MLLNEEEARLKVKGELNGSLARPMGESHNFLWRPCETALIEAGQEGEESSHDFRVKGVVVYSGKAMLNIVRWLCGFKLLATLTSVHKQSTYLPVGRDGKRFLLISPLPWQLVSRTTLLQSPSVPTLWSRLLCATRDCSTRRKREGPHAGTHASGFFLTGSLQANPDRHLLELLQRDFPASSKGFD